VKTVAFCAALLTLAGCATPSATPALPDFHGDYVHETDEMVDGSGDGFAIRDGIRIGHTRNGSKGAHAQVRSELYFRNAHQCNLNDQAEVTPKGLIYRERNADNGEPFTLAIDITGATATLRKVEGSGYWLCGMRGCWGGKFERTGKRVEFVEG